jgi:hypothetical protein
MDHARRDRFRDRLRGDAGEGVISAAIAVLVMAVIGAAMYLAFSGTMDDASGIVDGKVQEIGGG